MDTTHYKPLTSLPIPRGTVTNFGWGVGGTKTSTDNYSTYEISVYKHYYVYRRKPKWFGQYSGDRYLGKLRWISIHADGKQWRNAWMSGSINKWKVDRGNEKDSDAVAKDLLLVYGYLQPYIGFGNELRARHKVTNYRLSIRCAVCGTTCAELERTRANAARELSWPHTGARMDYWDARQLVRESVTCHTINLAASSFQPKV